MKICIFYLREPSARELAEREALTEEVNKALQKLGFAYSIILLGIGTSQFHHMGSGRYLYNNVCNLTRISKEFKIIMCEQ